VEKNETKKVVKLFMMMDGCCGERKENSDVRVRWDEDGESQR